MQRQSLGVGFRVPSLAGVLGGSGDLVTVYFGTSKYHNPN